ncbi:hypothetical protein [Burkholderia ubonensis]|uniref:hypothetical protein n=1 Tax=Burkholderia ubonensis TaxID=101571 RepID=UPI000ADD893D|nr:hypothetical protein [Burkholderia ubonensis]
MPNVGGRPGFSRQPANPSLSTYTSLNSLGSVAIPGSSNPYAQNIELDLPVTFLHEPLPNAYLRIWGISLTEIGQASNLQGMNVAIYGGMSAGLPLANASQSGILASGQILQSFGNWIGSDMTLDMYVFFGGSSPTSNQTTGNSSTTSTTPLPATNQNPANIIWQWSAGQSFNSAVTNSLSTVFPKYQIQGTASPNLAWTGAPEIGFFATVKQFAQYLNELSQKIIGGSTPNQQSYPGVFLAFQNNTITIGDGSTQTTPKQINFIDLIGQPTFSQPFQVQVSCVMRADIKVGDYVKLPPGPGIIQSGSASQFFNVQPGDQYSTAKSGSIFSGTFLVNAVRHVGNFRNPAAQSWITTLDLAYQPTPTSTVQAMPVLYSGNNSYNFHLPS